MSKIGPSVLAVGGVILSGFYYVLPKITCRIYPTCIKLIMSGGVIVNSICRSRSRETLEKNANVIYNLFRGFARTASSFLLGPIPITHTEVSHGRNIGEGH